MLSFAISAVLLGFSAGISPGPMTALVISETVKNGRGAGIRVAMAPLFSDAPIILVCYFILSKLQNNLVFLGVFSIIGAVFLFYLGYSSIRIKTFNTAVTPVHTPLLKGILVNFLNPHPYVFWMTIGAAFILRTMQHSTAALIVFLAVFYLCLIGAKVILAFITGFGHKMLQEKTLLWLVRIMGGILIVFGFILAYEGLKYF